MPNRKKPLRKCPECGRRLADKNHWHPRTKIGVAQHLHDKTASAIELYRALEAAVTECGLARAHPTRTRIGFIARMTFAGSSLAVDEIDDELREWLREAYRVGWLEHLAGWRWVARRST